MVCLTLTSRRKLWWKSLLTNEKTNIVDGFGYQWKCKTTGWESGWHATYSGSAKLAIAHQSQYAGHVATVYAV